LNLSKEKKKDELMEHLKKKNDQTYSLVVNEDCYADLYDL